jgi:VIT1/CCC1 family predicted Fe2+/Mn2+ transporter
MMSDLEQPLCGDQEPRHASADKHGQPHEHPHEHYSHRAPWLRAFVLGANDGLVSIASLVLGVGAGSGSLQAIQVRSGPRMLKM